jgi:hypothetical protein
MLGSYKMENIIPCTHCGKPTSFERDNETQPHEGEVCPICDEWVCVDCVDWVATEERNDEWIVCKECVEAGYGKEKVE